MHRILLALALAGAFCSHAWAADSDGAKADPALTPEADEAPPMAKKAKRKPRAPQAVPVFIEGAGTVWVCARPSRQR